MTSSSTNTSETRRFGVIAFVFFGCLSALGLYTKKAIPSYLFGFLSIVGFSFILFPSQLRPVYGAWLRIAYLLGRAVTILILTLVYYLVITPAGFIKCLVSGTPVPVKFNKDATSYWVVRTESIQPKERFIKRY
jgi:hypothetical protein